MRRQGFLGLFDIIRDEEFGEQAEKFLRENPWCIFARDTEGRTLMHEAAFHNNCRIMGMIINKWNQMDVGQVAEKLKEMGERQIDTCLEVKDLLGWTPLFTAVANRKWAAASFLKNGGADIFARDIYGKNILHHLIKNDDWISTLALLPRSDLACLAKFNQPDCAHSKPLDVILFKKDEKNYDCHFFKIVSVLRFLSSLPLLEKDVQIPKLMQREFVFFEKEVQQFLDKEVGSPALSQDLLEMIESFSVYLAKGLHPKPAVQVSLLVMSPFSLSPSPPSDGDDQAATLKAPVPEYFNRRLGNKNAFVDVRSESTSVSKSPPISEEEQKKNLVSLFDRDVGNKSKQYSV